MKLSTRFFLRQDTLLIARSLLGKLLVVPDGEGNRVSGMIVETEAYLGPNDRAAHSFGGRRTTRNEVMYGVGGRAYVFFVYGMYYQFNVVTGSVDRPHAVLIRAIEPVENLELMTARRGGLKQQALTSGPGKLCIALGIDRSMNGEDLRGERVWLEQYKTFRESHVSTGKRVGIDYAQDYIDKPWRFWVTSNKFVSKSR